MIPRSTIDAIREKVDIAELVESKGVSLKRIGSRMVGLCPVHSERTPSFNVNTTSNTFICFGCGIKGDVFKFLMEVDSYTFAGAVEELGEMTGIEVIDDAGEDPDFQRKKDYYRTVGSAAWFYRTRFADLPEDHPAKQDLARRNYLTVEGRESWLEEFGMGYAPGTGDALSSFLSSQGYSPEQILDAGLAFQDDRTGRLRDRFRNRLMWEIRDIRGRPIGFSGRRLNEEDNPKYLNTPETVLYKKSHVLVGLDLARKKMTDDKAVFIGEGAADAQAIAAAGYTNAVASCGTGFGAGHVSVLRRIIDDFNAQDNGKFIFVFDGDEAGMKAAARMFDLQPSIKERSYVAELDGLDPVDFRVEYGDDALRHRLDNPVPLTEFMLRRIASKYDLHEIESRSAFIKEAMRLISYIEEPDIFEGYKRKIAAMSGVAMAHLRGRTAPVSHYDEGSTQEPVEPTTEVTARRRVGELMVACLLQYPNESFAVLRDKPEVASRLQDGSLQLMMIEAMNKTGFTAVRGVPTTLTPGDFTDSEMTVHFFHMDLQTQQDRASALMERLVKNLDEIHRRAEAEQLRVAMSDGAISDKEALQQILVARKQRN